MKVTTNFGEINGRRTVTFKVSDDGKVIPAKYLRDEDSLGACCFEDGWISSHEAFRRWKIARKAWKTRKFRNQLSLGI